MIDILNRAYGPTLDEIAEYTHNPLFSDFCSEIREKYRCKDKIEYSSCSWEPGWNVKLKKSGKNLCTPEIKALMNKGIIYGNDIAGT